MRSRIWRAISDGESATERFWHTTQRSSARDGADVSSLTVAARRRGRCRGQGERQERRWRGLHAGVPRAAAPAGPPPDMLGRRRVTRSRWPALSASNGSTDSRKTVSVTPADVLPADHALAGRSRRSRVPRRRRSRSRPCRRDQARSGKVRPNRWMKSSDAGSLSWMATPRTTTSFGGERGASRPRAPALPRSTRGSTTTPRSSGRRPSPRWASRLTALPSNVVSAKGGAGRPTSGRRDGARVGAEAVGEEAHDREGGERDQPANAELHRGALLAPPLPPDGRRVPEQLRVARARRRPAAGTPRSAWP